MRFGEVQPRKERARAAWPGYEKVAYVSDVTWDSSRLLELPGVAFATGSSGGGTGGGETEEGGQPSTLGLRFELGVNFSGVEYRGYSHVNLLERKSHPSSITIPSSGELITEQYLFGRGFESPPEFNFSLYGEGLAREEISDYFDMDGGNGWFSLSAPIVGVGVERWIVDNKGVYCGAILWIKIRVDYSGNFNPPV